MSYRLLRCMPPVHISESILELYRVTGNEDVHMDESDLVILRLMGANFNYSETEFKEVSLPAEQAESAFS